MSWVAVVLVGVAACRPSDSVAACEAAVKNCEDAVDVCRSAYAEEPTPLVGGQLARALAASTTPAVEEIQALAEKVGDLPGGADAWHALGVANEKDSEKAIAAFLHSLARRSPAETRRRLVDYSYLYHHFTKQDRFREALHYAALAYDLAAASREPALRGYVYAGVATFLYDIGDLPAVESLSREADAVIDESNKYWPHVQKLRGIVKRARSNPKLAAIDFQASLKSARALGYSNLAHDVSFELATTYLSIGDIGSAAAVVDADVFGAKPSGDDKDENEEWARHMRIAAEIDVTRGNNTHAIKTIDEAMPFASPAVSADLQAIRGHALLQLGDLDDAELVLQAAAAAYEQQRSELGFDTLKPWLAAARRAPLEDLVTIAIARRRDTEAFEIVQRAMARSLLDGLTHPDSEGTSVAGDLVLADEHLTRLASLNTLHISIAVQPPAAAELMASLVDVHVLTYFRARNRLWLIDLPAGGQPHAIDLGSSDSIHALVEKRAWSPDDRSVYETLGQRLLPREIQLIPGEALHVAQDDLIRDVPFNALVRDGAFLIERYPVATEPSAAVLAALRARRAPRGSAVVVGNATNDLPVAERDAIDVGARMSVQPHVRGTATRASIFAAANANLLHIATHSTATSLGPAIKTADGLVNGGEIIDHRVHPAIVVLASCSTADPRDRAELGPIASSFLAAGSQTVIASRLSVSEELASRYTRAFYDADALRSPGLANAIAQRQLIADGESISSWSTFEVFGLTTGGR